MGCPLWLLVLLLLTGLFAVVAWACRRELYKNPYKNPNNTNSWVLAKHKVVTSRILQLNNIPCPRFVHVESPCTDATKLGERLEEFHIGFPVVVKATSLSQGQSVHVNLTSSEEVCRAISQVLGNPEVSDAIVEEHVFGKDFRILVLDGRVWDVVERVRAKVTGDGVRTGQQLIDARNQRRRRRGRPQTHNVTWPFIADQLGLRGRPRSVVRAHIVPEGDVIEVTNVANRHNGCSVQRVPLSTVHPDNLELFERISNILGLVLAGIDFLSLDLGTSYREIGHVIEVNFAPGVALHVEATPLEPTVTDRLARDLAKVEALRKK